MLRTRSYLCVFTSVANGRISPPPMNQNNCRPQDSTAYARSIGYAREKPVLVLDGKVFSHRCMDWFVFCDRCRKGKMR